MTNDATIQDAQANVEARVKQIIANHFGMEIDGLQSDALLKEDLSGDSLDAIEIVMEIEEAFGIEIEDDESSDIQSVGQAVQLAQAKVLALRK
jgi:acyl carrier protein